jgi:3-oxoacyl-[acyl-carrier-protein] synthase III
VIGRAPEGYGVLSASLSADGALAGAVGIPAGGTRLAPSPETFARRQHFVRVDGREVRRYATETLPEVMRRSLGEAGLGPEDVDLAVFHGPNPALLASCMEAAGVDPSKAHLSVERYGNIAAASVPISLHEARAAGRVGRGAVVVLAAVGGGMTAGSIVLRWY